MSSKRRIPAHSSTNAIRAAFLDYFAKNGHQPVASSPLVPQNDPTLMFTNAGMVQFKNVFTGLESRDYRRAVTSQKCVRAGGKHNDLDNVGYTARHHTFFEMLGNFSFGDYFKEDAIRFAWEFLTEELKLPKEKLGFTVYHTDDEAYDLWKQITGCADDKILRIPTKDNFWSMGDVGPCGPCSEIFYDHGADAAEGEWALDEDGNDLFGDRFIEIWNLVFMQFEVKEPGGEQHLLPKPSIDTGMGLERIAAVLQGVHDNYEIDLFQSLIDSISEIIGVAAEGERFPSFKVIADHIRSSCFLIADGVMPSNEGRGYVLRRIMRRAMRHVHLLGYDKPLMHQLVPILIQEMGEAYPELERARALMTETLRQEEERFLRTLSNGLEILEAEIGALAESEPLHGAVAFKLYDTYGFPLDLTEDILRGQSRNLDMEGFTKAMEAQKARARANWKGSGAAATASLWFDLAEKLPTTEFLGYSTTEAQGEILAVITNDQPAEGAQKDAEVMLIANQTPFYGESGGQMGDVGTILTESGAEIRITDTQKPLPSLIVHHGTVEQGTVKVGDSAQFTVNKTYRDQMRANHSATHLLHQALRDVLGEHVVQKGSLVAADRLRFDFAHGKALTAEQRKQIELRVNAEIRANHGVKTQLSTPEEAIEAGALALFGEKYDEEVRVVSMGSPTGSRPFSVELCGGTHVHATGDIGLFIITGESAVAAGIRRVEALTGEAAFNWLKEQRLELEKVADALRTSPAEATQRAEILVKERKAMEKEITQLKAKIAMGGGSNDNQSQTDAVEEIAGISFIGRSLSGVPAKELRGLVDQYKKQHSPSVIALTSDDNGKASLVVGVTENVSDKIDAVALVKHGAEAIGAKGGGGRRDFAQTGGPNAAGAKDALNAIKSAMQQLLAG